MLIGLTGNAGAGKDSAAAVLCAAGFKSAAFADALRIEVAAAWRIDPRLLTERAGKDAPLHALAVGMVHDANWLRWCSAAGHRMLTPRSPRWCLQQWGSWRRSVTPDYWARHMRVWINHHCHFGNLNLVASDVRYPNEAATLRNLGGHIVRVHRPGQPGLPPDTAGHESELHWQIRTDGDIHNDGSLADLGAEVWRVVKLLSALDSTAAIDPSTTTSKTGA